MNMIPPFKQHITFPASISIIAAIVLVLGGCGLVNTTETVTLSGQVIEKANGNPIADAVIEIIEPASLRNSTTSDATGGFTLSVDIDSTVTVTVEVSKQDFKTLSKTFKVTKDADLSDLLFEMEAQDGTGGGEEEQVSGEPEGAAAIVLTKVPLQAINIAETGDIVSSAFTFQVQDSAGRPLNIEKAVTVKFNIISGPGGGEAVIPDTARTNADGKVTTSLFSGNKAGPVKVQAIVERPEVGLTIKSSPVLIAIHGGFPDLDHFSLTLERSNIEGYNINNVRDEVTVIVGDKFSNPVKPGTVVYFETTGGIIEGSATTDDNGVASVELITADPRPNDAVSGSGGRPGYGTVTAKTVDENNTVISKSNTVLFSGLPQNPIVSPSTFNIPANGGVNFTYTVTDQFGNPLAAGTKFQVEVGQGLDATGDVNFTLGDFLFPGEGATEFAFSVTDTDQTSSDSGGTSITVRVTTPFGKQASTTIQGTRAKTSGS